MAFKLSAVAAQLSFEQARLMVSQVRDGAGNVLAEWCAPAFCRYQNIPTCTPSTTAHRACAKSSPTPTTLGCTAWQPTA